MGNRKKGAGRTLPSFLLLFSEIGSSLDITIKRKKIMFSWWGSAGGRNVLGDVLM